MAARADAAALSDFHRSLEVSEVARVFFRDD
jgi:hypothetical protein